MGQPMGQQPQPAAAANPAQTAGILMMVCALAIAIGTFTKSWFAESEGGGEVGVGLTGMKMCGRGECMAMSWGDMDKMGGKIPGDIKLFGYLGFLAGIASVGAAAAAGGLALSRNSHKIPEKVLLGIFGAASFSMTFFLVRFMTEDKKMPGISFSGFLAIGGLIGAGMVLKSMLGPIIKRGQLAAGPGGYAPAGAAMGAPMGGAAVAPVPCPRCGGQAGFVAQYNRHFCTACQQYV